MLDSVKKSLFVVFVLWLSATAYADDQARSCSIVILGDSLSAAYGLKPEQGWVAMLRDHWQSTSPTIKVINASVSGATTADGLRRLPDIIKRQQPKGVFIELGGNDGLQGKPVAYISKNLEKLIKLSNQNAQVFVTGMRLPPNYGTRYTEPFFSMYAELSKKYETGYDSFLLDGVAIDNTLMFSDGIHPNAQGQQHIYERIAPILDNWLNTKACPGALSSSINTTLQ